MLRSDEIDALRDAATELTQPIIDYLLRDLAGRIARAGQFTATAQYEVWKLQQLGVSQREVKKRLKELLKVSNQELRRLLTQSAEAGYNYDLRSLPQVRAIPFQQNEAVQQIVAAAVRLAESDLTNITQTLGMVDPYGRALPLRDAYRACMDFAFSQVATGAADYNTAVRQAARNLAEKGVRWIDYESGVHTSLEAAVRRNIMGGLGLMQEQISQRTHDDLGADGWEIDAHSNSAPDHEPIQGRQYPDAEYQALNNSLVRRIGTLNCGHSAHPIILSVSTPQYSAAELEEMRQKNEEGTTYNGRHYTGYEATQRQRSLEAAMRRQKRRILVDEAAGDEKKLQTDQIRLQMLRQEYARFSKAAGLRTQTERAETAGFGWKQAGAADKAARTTKNPVEIARDRATMEVNEPVSEGGRVRKVGNLDIKKYHVVTDQIRTDEVIITDERIQHIKDRHPNDFERYAQYITRIVENPDYILEANKPNTAFLLKEFLEDGERFQLIVRLAVEGDAPGYKNSVITFLKVEEKRYRRYLRTKKILYKSE